MQQKYPNTLGSERTVEIAFIEEMIVKYHNADAEVLDVGGVPSDSRHFQPIYKIIEEEKINYKVADFRGGHYAGDFVSYDFKKDKFDLIIFLSSLEHFPQCTESDKIYRHGEDKKGYEKALSILKNNGVILLTVPFGKHRWQEYHQNYDFQGILNLTKGSTIAESFTYRLMNDTEDKANEEWRLSDPLTMDDIIYSDRAYGVGCFVLKKDEKN
jgi:SAM-dependent methyltransferase